MYIYNFIFMITLYSYIMDSVLTYYIIYIEIYNKLRKCRTEEPAELPVKQGWVRFRRDEHLKATG